MVIADDHALVRIVKSLPVSEFEGPVYRLVPLKYVGQWDATEGARRLGGRFNPPEGLQRASAAWRRLRLALHGDAVRSPVYSNVSTSCGRLTAGMIQSVPKEPKILLSFHAESDRVLDLRDASNQVAALGLDPKELLEPDDRYDLNEAGKLTAVATRGGGRVIKRDAFRAFRLRANTAIWWRAIVSIFFPAK